MVRSYCRAKYTFNSMLCLKVTSLIIFRLYNAQDHEDFPRQYILKLILSRFISENNGECHAKKYFLSDYWFQSHLLTVFCIEYMDIIFTQNILLKSITYALSITKYCFCQNIIINRSLIYKQNRACVCRVWETVDFGYTQNRAVNLIFQFHIVHSKHIEQNSKYHIEQSSQYHIEQSSQYHIKQSSQYHIKQSNQYHIKQSSQSYIDYNSQFYIEQSTQTHIEQNSQSYIEQSNQSCIDQSSIIYRTIQSIQKKAVNYIQNISQFHIEQNSQYRIQQSLIYRIEQFHIEQSRQSYIEQSSHLIQNRTISFTYRIEQSMTGRMEQSISPRVEHQSHLEQNI